MLPKPVTWRPPGAEYQIRALGAQRRPLRDFYHGLVKLNWPATLAVITVGYLLLNVLFACLYAAIGGIANAQPGSLSDAFFFSVQTMGTIGYGAMYPKGPAGNWLMVLESVVSLIFTALATGLIFAKFSRPTARIMFSHCAVISPVNGKPTLMFRIGNERGNAIVDAQLRGMLSRVEHTQEGHQVYRLHELRFTRERALSLNRALNVSHTIDEGSPLYGQSPESILAQDYEMQVMVVGIDDTVKQQVHAQHLYFARDIRFGSRLRDILSEDPNGDMVIDLRGFHELDPSQPTEWFPYPKTPA
jgi:inward rectifier potassium channel